MVITVNPKFISWKQPFPGIEHIAHFPMSTPRRSDFTGHGWPRLLIRLMIFRVSRGRGRGVRSGDMPNLPDNLLGLGLPAPS